MAREFKHPNAWKHAKYVSWPPSWATPLIRVPLRDGRYISRSITMREGECEIELLARCRALRDAIAIPIWGAAKWNQILRVPKRSVTKLREDSKTPYNGIQLIEQSPWASYYSASWYEFDGPEKMLAEAQSVGHRMPRRKRTKTFSFGTPHARFPSDEAALAAAIEFIKQKQQEQYVVVHER